MNSIEEKRRSQKCPRGIPEQRQEGPRHPKGGPKKKNKITYSPAQDIDLSSIQDDSLKGETCIESETSGSLPAYGC